MKTMKEQMEDQQLETQVKMRRFESECAQLKKETQAKQNNPVVNHNEIDFQIGNRKCSKWWIIIGVLITIIVIQFIVNLTYGIILRQHEDDIDGHKHTSAGILKPSASEVVAAIEADGEVTAEEQYFSEFAMQQEYNRLEMIDFPARN